MSEKEKIYKSLQKEYTLAELADAVILSDASTKMEEEEFVKLRLARRNTLSEKEQLFSSLLSLKYEMKFYLNKTKFEPKNNFGIYLKKYLKIVRRTQKKLAEEIDIHPSRLSRIIKGKERVGKSLVYRLESHSGDLIPAIFWWKIFQKEVEQEIVNAIKEREIEKQYVKKIAYRT
ncbi:MAG: helix-turn-helix domain-containing protein [Saprospiraceae bacterium]